MKDVAYRKPSGELPSIDYDVAVIDYQMPGLNGIELLNEMMRFEKYRSKPAVFGKRCFPRTLTNLDWAFRKMPLRH